jgi:OOP family OmpA-OmpF porin
MSHSLSNIGAAIACGLVMTACAPVPQDDSVFVINWNPYDGVAPEPAPPQVTSLPPVPSRLDVPSDVLFALDSAALRPEARRIIDSVVDQLRRDARLEVEIHGYTDTAGSREHNQQLSQKRADAVAQALAHNGIDIGRIDRRGFGETNLKVQTRDGVREPRNRRVEIILKPRLDSARASPPD